TAEQKQLVLIEEVIHQKALEFATLLRVFEKAESASIEFLPQFCEELKNILKILLLVDNAISHNIDNFEDYPNIYVYFLSSNVTAYLQLIDARIINAFKAHYKCFYIHQTMQLVKAVWNAIKLEPEPSENSETLTLIQEYLNDNESIDTEDFLNDKQIIEFVKNPINNNNEPNNQVDEEPKITFAEAKKNLNQLLSFIH
ncbi:17466_t:CDS:2, partial [Cetraspora pellucida]